MKLSELKRALADLEKASRLRLPDDALERERLELQFGPDFIDAASNDYLGLARLSGHVSRGTITEQERDSLLETPKNLAQGQPSRAALSSSSLEPPSSSLSTSELLRDEAGAHSKSGEAVQAQELGLHALSEQALGSPPQASQSSSQSSSLESSEVSWNRSSLADEPEVSGSAQGSAPSPRGSEAELGSIQTWRAENLSSARAETPVPVSRETKLSGATAFPSQPQGQGGSEAPASPRSSPSVRTRPRSPSSSPPTAGLSVRIEQPFVSLEGEFLSEQEPPAEASHREGGSDPALQHSRSQGKEVGGPAEQAASASLPFSRTRNAGKEPQTRADQASTEEMERPRGVESALSALDSKNALEKGQGVQVEGSRPSRRSSRNSNWSDQQECGSVSESASSERKLQQSTVPLARSVSRETEASSSRDPAEAAEPISPTGAGSSRLIFGSSQQHLSLEQELAEWVGLPSSLLFASGYAANVGALGALLSPEDAVFSDSLNHASLIDGIRLSRAKARVFSHLDLEELEKGLRASSQAPARWVICESYYSMDGDGPDLAALRSLSDRHDAHLYIDEAHSLGTFGPRGAGLCAQAGVKPDVLMAAFGKSVGSQGACIAGSTELRTWLWNRARSFVFSTASSPLLAEATRRQIARTQRADSERARLEIICERTRRGLENRGAPLVQASFGPVVGLLLRQEEKALLLASRLRESGILAQAIRPPTVAVGASRVRLVLRSSFSDSQIDRLVCAVADECARL